MIPPHFAHLPGDMQLFPNCPDFFPLFILPTPKGVFYSHPVLFRDALSWLILLLRKVLSYNREETAPLVLKQIFMWNLTSTLMFSKTISHTTFWGRFSRKSGFVSYHLWSVSLSYLLYCHLFHHFHHVFFYSKECQSPFFGLSQVFLMVCTHITQATASSKHTSSDLFLRMLQTPPFQVNTTTHYPKFS